MCRGLRRRRRRRVRAERSSLRRARFSRTRGRRDSSLSSATSSMSASSARCVALPPGAAHASSTRCPGSGCRSGAASCAPGSWTANAPASNPGSTRGCIAGSDDDAGIAHRRGGDFRFGERRQQRVARRDAAIHAKREWRLRVAGREHRLPFRREFALHALDPPARVRPARDGIGVRGQLERVALAQKAAQERIDQRLGRGTRQHRRGVDRMIDDGEGRRSRMQELIERDRHETAKRSVRDRLRRERAHVCFEPAPVPQRAVCELEHERAAAAGQPLSRRSELRERRGERLPRQHPLDREGR